MLEKFLLAVSLTFALNSFINISWSEPKKISNKIHSLVPNVLILAQRDE